MSTTEAVIWRHTSPLAAIFFLGKIYRTIAQNAVQSLLPLVAFGFAYEGSLMTKVTLGIGAFVSITIIISIVRYWFFRYKIAEDSVLIREGVIKKTELNIKFDRIQAISTTQNIVYRIFDLVTIKLDTAGSAGQEGHLPAIKKALATSLRDKIRRKPVSANRDKGESDDAEDAIHPVRSLLALGSGDLVRIGLCDNRALIFLAFLGLVIKQLDQRIEQGIEDGAGEVISGQDVVSAIVATAGGVQASVAVGLLLVFGFLLFLGAASIIGAFLRYHKFELVADNDILRSTGGLLTRHEHSINLAKIQTVVASQGIMLRLFGRFRLKARQATSSKRGKCKSLTIPICTPRQLAPLTAELFGGEFAGLLIESVNTAFRPIAKQFIRSRLVLTGLLPAGVAMAVLSSSLGWHAIWALLWIPVALFGVWCVYRRYGVLVSEDGLALRQGFFGYRVTAFLHRKVQRISVTQTLLQRRKGLATMQFYLASGLIKVPYVDFAKAKALRDYVLFRVETSQLAWH